MVRKTYREQQEQTQASLDAEKWQASQEAGRDLSGEMPYCEFCKNNIFGTFCRNNQEEREKGCLCARALHNQKNKARAKK